MPIVRQAVQSVQKAAPETREPLMSEPQFSGNCVRRPKADPPDIICEAVGIFLDDGNALTAIGFENLCRMAGAHIVTLQKEHYIFDLLLLRPALFDLIDTCLSDSGHMKKPVGIILDHFQGILSEGLNDPAGILWPDSSDHSAAEVFFDPVDRCGQGLLKALNRKLAAVLCVDPPAAGQLQDTPHMYFGHRTDDCHQFAESLRPAAYHGITVHLIMVGNAFNNTAQSFHE